jgi:hypothetical protein
MFRFRRERRAAQLPGTTGLKFERHAAQGLRFRV